MTQRSRKVLFAGSFDPFTIGHADLVQRALCLFDEVVIAVGVNIDKATQTDVLASRLEPVRRLYAADSRVTVTSFTGLAVECAREHGCCAMLRGVRTAADLDYERSMAELNRRLSAGAIDTVLLCARPELEAVSSSAVRELRHYGADVSWMLPPAVDQK